MLLWWLLIALMLACNACHRDFRNFQALSNHRSSCKKVKAQNAAKQARRRARIEEAAAQAAVMDMDVVQNDLKPDMADNADCDMDIPIPGPSNAAVAGLALPPTRSGRQRTFPAAYKDYLPSLPTSLPHMPRPIPRNPPQPRESTPEPSPEPEPAIKTSTFETEPNEFGLYRVYTTYPANDPEESLCLDDMCDDPGISVARDTLNERTGLSGFGSRVTTAGKDFFAPFLNATVYRLMNWFYSGSNMKSLAELDALVDVIRAPDFDPEDLQGFSAARELARLDNDFVDQSFHPDDGWRESSVKIRLPAEKVKHASEQDAPEFEVKGVYHRSLLDVIRTACTEPVARAFHWIPFRLFWKPSPDEPSQRVITEVYNSDAFITEHEKIQAQPRDPGCNLETAIIAILLWSDSTHLANFGTASLWPIYLFFGNQSKYSRSKPTSFAAHHLAYLPKIPNIVQDIYGDIFGGMAASAATLTHLKRELMHAIWLLLLDPEFMHAYVHGIVVKCADGVTRRLFPRFFTYSADYPEKVLLATIRYLANCPCPRCLIDKDQIFKMGTKFDRRQRENTREDTPNRRSWIERARQFIFEKGLGVMSAAVERLLKPRSWVPTRNAFSERLAEFGFNFYSMFVPDLLHEFELGVWKSVFTHLLRVLYAAGEDKIQILNRRFRQVPTFGRDTIRKFSNNASGMKKLAARDFEDLLQCAIPVFEGLLPAPHNGIILDLLFDLAVWHAFAKLRLHTSTTLLFHDKATTTLGQTIRRFSNKTCSTFKTYELPSEEAARGRREARYAAATDPDGRKTKKSKKNDGPRQRQFNMSTYKLHALGDYVKTISMYGTTDNYSTQVGELEHRRVKRFYARTNKRRQFAAQIAKHQLREQRLWKMRTQQQTTRDASTVPTNSPAVPFEESEPLPPSPPTKRYHVSDSQKHFENVTDWLNRTAGDPATVDFLPRLKNHLLRRVLGQPFDGEEVKYSDDDRNSLTIIKNRLYKHKTIRFNYTTYDMRRAQDTVNPRTHPDVMVLAHEDDAESNPHPYWYARVIGIFHAEVRHAGTTSNSSETRAVDFLWVRWFGRDLQHRSGWKAKRLHRVGFVDSAEPEAFGFLDPADVIRAVHMIPAFAFGHTSDLLAPSIARQLVENDEDWVYYYVGMFVDRDMFMRFVGGGVGHKGLWYALGWVLEVTRLAFCGEAEAVDADDIEGSETEGGADLPPADVGLPNTLEELLSEGMQVDAEASENDDEGYSSNEEDQNSEDDEDDDEVGDLEGNDLGPDDGEETVEDPFQAAGYAPL
ncbi:hypothetical protein LshimejAT787_0101380 [Lyophyllum shimeji]|uniref:C2H2-type domain-containing protein n=1 Tax=Lyophyllum shimeji TaxID=47721 RepID=A0A9P3PD36_LYOSH|nr:hypothetical protein LshimejAT787_0101380 [Lyophyllum shimeji]